MKLTNRFNLLIAMMLFTGFAGMAQKSTVTNNSKNTKTTEMKTYVIEREIPGASTLTGNQLKDISRNSCSVIKEIGPQIQWVHTDVAGNKFYCIYKAENEELVREHAKKGGFPANSITEVATMISPATSN